MPIRNQIEAIVQTLNGSPSFYYGSLNEQWYYDHQYEKSK